MVNFEYYNWEELLGALSNVVFWTFEELDVFGPDPKCIIDACPIRLHVDDVTEHVLSFQKEAIIENGKLF